MFLQEVIQAVVRAPMEILYRNNIMMCLKMGKIWKNKI